MNCNKVLELEGVGKDFGSISALSEVSLSLDAGQILCLVGRSGCGKSTMLRLIGGIERPDFGSIRIHGQEVAGQASFVEPDQRNIGFVFQDYALFPHLTVAENIAFGIRSLPKNERSRRVSEMLDLVGMQTMAERYAHSLSGGEQQRIALARALAPRPKLLLLDEPFSNLDLNLKRRVRSETIALLRQVEATAIMVTHDPQEALAIGDRVVLLNQGRIVQQGLSDDIYHRPVDTYAAEFFSDFNKVEGVVEHGMIATELGRFPNNSQLAEGVKCWAYIRPQSIGFLRDEDVRHTTEGFEASLIHRSFMGDIEELTYQLYSVPRVLKMTRLSGQEPAPIRARLSISSQSILIFSR